VKLSALCGERFSEELLTAKDAKVLAKSAKKS
jgi:hypothetical protein